MAVRRAILGVGQSNVQPTASIGDYLVLVPEFNVAALTLDPANPALDAYYGRAATAIRFLTPYHPEQIASYPGGAPPAPFTSWDKYALFLPWTAFEGVFLNQVSGPHASDAGSTVTKFSTGVPATFTAADIGRYIKITAGAQINQRRKITALADADGSVVWVNVMPGAPGAGDTATINNLANRLTNPNALIGAAPVPAEGRGFLYPNAFALPRGPIYDESAEPIGQFVAAYPGTISVMVDIARRMIGWLGQHVYVMQLGIGSTSINYTEDDLPAFSQWSWFQPKLHTHWSPGDELTGLAKRLLDLLDTAKLAVQAVGDTLVIEGVACFESESDSVSANARELFAENAPKFVDWVTQAIYDRGLCEVAPWQLPFGWAGIPNSPWGTTQAAAINDVLVQMQKDRPAFFTWDTNSFGKNAAPDTAHFNAAGIMSQAAAWFDGFLAARIRRFASVPDTDVPTLGEIRTSVLRLSQNNTEVPDDATTARLDEAINQEIDEINAEIGDSAWYLRQVLQESLTFSPWAPTELPRVVQRLLELRPTSFPTETIDFTMISHGDQGRVRVVAQNVHWAGLVDIHHRIEPRKLIATSEKPVLPKGVYIEAVVVGAAVRMVKTSGNAQLETKLRVDRDRLRMLAVTDAARVDRQRRERMRGYRGKSGYPGSRYPWKYSGYSPLT